MKKSSSTTFFPFTDMELCFRTVAMDA